MKTSNLSFILVLLFVSFALEINANGVKDNQEFALKVIGLEQTDYEYIFRLKQESIFPKVNLDCQSFFNGLHFLSKEEKIIDRIDLDSHECEQLFLMIQKMEGKSLCLNVQLVKGDLSIDQSGSSCL